MTKQQQLIMYMTSHGSITHELARKHCNIQNLRAEINRLRNLGYVIATDKTAQNETQFILIGRKAR